MLTVKVVKCYFDYTSLVTFLCRTFKEIPKIELFNISITYFTYKRKHRAIPQTTHVHNYKKKVFSPFFVQMIPFYCRFNIDFELIRII